MIDQNLLNDMRTFAAMSLKEKYTIAFDAVSNHFNTVCFLTLAIYLVSPIIYKFMLAFLFLFIKALIGQEHTIYVFNNIDIPLIANLGTIFCASFIMVGFCSILLLYTMNEEPDSRISEIFLAPFQRFASCAIPLVTLFSLLLVIYLPLTLIPILGTIIKVLTAPFLFVYLICFIFYLAHETETTTQEVFINSYRIILVNLPSWALAAVCIALLIPSIFFDKISFLGPGISILYLIFFYALITIFTSCILCFMAITYHQSRVRLILDETQGSWQE